MTDQCQIDTAAACEVLSKIERSGSFAKAYGIIDDHHYLGLRILRRVIDYLRDPHSWSEYRNRGFRTPTARFWEGE